MKPKHLLLLAILLCLCSAGFAGYQITALLREYHAGEQTYDAIQQFAAPPATETSPTVPEAAASTEPSKPPETEPVREESADFPTVDFDALQAINNDVVAWICIEDTKINYPVVQGEDNKRYLTELIDGTVNSAGSIFMDYRNEPDFSDQNTVLYGHHMKNGSMFTGIQKYRSQAYYDAHPDILVTTPDGNYKFEVVAGYVAKTTESAWQLEFSSDELMLEWIGDAISRSAFQSAAVPEPGDTFLTLSTCTYEFRNARFVLVAVLKD